MTWLRRYSYLDAGIAFWITDRGEVIKAPTTHSDAIDDFLRAKYGIEQDENPVREEWEEIIPEDEWYVMTGPVTDYSRAYDLAIDKWNWIRVAGDNVEMRDEQSRTLRMLSAGLYDAYLPYGKNLFNTTFFVEIHSRGSNIYKCNYTDIMDGEIPLSTGIL